MVLRPYGGRNGSAGASAAEPTAAAAGRILSNVRRLLLILVLAAPPLALSACGGDAGRWGAARGVRRDLVADAAGRRAGRPSTGGCTAATRASTPTCAAASCRRPPSAACGLRQVRVTDTADAVQRVVAQRRAGERDGGEVDLIWINGENFASGKRAGLWLKDWAGRLPNARFLDFGGPDDRVATSRSRSTARSPRGAAPRWSTRPTRRACAGRRARSTALLGVGARAPRPLHLSGAAGLHRVGVRAPAGPVAWARTPRSPTCAR